MGRCVRGLHARMVSGRTVRVEAITSPQKSALAAAKRIAAGDLTGKYATTRSDEYGELLIALHALNDRLLRVVSGVRAGTTTVASTSTQINRDSTALSDRTVTQAKSLQQTAASMEELTAAVKQNSDSAHQITEIVGVIDSIAFQTNLLALNAAVAEIDNMVSKNAQLAKSTAKTTAVINEQAVALLKSVSEFNLGGRDHGNNPHFIGLGSQTKDVDGKFFVQEMARMVKAQGRRLDRLQVGASGHQRTPGESHVHGPRRQLGRGLWHLQRHAGAATRRGWANCRCRRARAGQGRLNIIVCRPLTATKRLEAFRRASRRLDRA